MTLADQHENFDLFNLSADLGKSRAKVAFFRGKSRANVSIFRVVSRKRAALTGSCKCMTITLSDLLHNVLIRESQMNSY